MEPSASDHHAGAGRAAHVGEMPPTPCLYVSSPAVNNHNRFVSIILSSCFIIAYYRHLAESAIKFEPGCDETRPLLDEDGRPAGNIFLLRHWQTLSSMRQEKEVLSHLGFDGSPFQVDEAVDPEPSMNLLKSPVKTRGRGKMPVGRPRKDNNFYPPPPTNCQPYRDEKNSGGGFGGGAGGGGVGGGGVGGGGFGGGGRGGIVA